MNKTKRAEKDPDNLKPFDATSGPFHDLRLILEYGRDSTKEAAASMLAEHARGVKRDHPELLETEKQVQTKYPSRAQGMREIASIGILRDLQEILQSNDEDVKEAVRSTIKACLTNVRRGETVRRAGLDKEVTSHE